ncbi:MAG TPA: DUF2169 domain-containing protein, partial [Minicystis sp.]|nr:DUF2169 domain-containing protein [Minicystis sp.]
MKVVKPHLIGVLHRTFEHDRKHYLVVSALVAFRLTDPERLVQDPLLWKAASEELGRDGVLELGMSKQRGEVLVTGRAYPSSGPQPAVSVRLRVGGTIDKTLYVVGDRRWEANGWSPPAPFSEMPIAWANAFGGDGFADNPVGKGLASVVVDGREVHPLPNVEDPKDLVRSPRDRPKPAGFAPIDLLWPARFSKMGTHDAAWLKDLYPGFARDLDGSVFQAAPRDQWIEGYFRGDEAFSLEHMHPTLPVLEGKLPGYVVRAFLRHRGAEALREVPTRIDTLHFFPHKDL